MNDLPILVQFPFHIRAEQINLDEISKGSRLRVLTGCARMLWEYQDEVVRDEAIQRAEARLRREAA